MSNDKTTEGGVVKRKMTEEEGISFQCNKYEWIPDEIMETGGWIADRRVQKTGGSSLPTRQKPGAPQRTKQRPTEERDRLDPCTATFDRDRRNP
jgi:hypothetical protein